MKLQAFQFDFLTENFIFRHDVDIFLLFLLIIIFLLHTPSFNMRR